MPITRRVAAKRGTPPMFLHDGQFRGHEGCYSNPFLGKFRNWNTPNNCDDVHSSKLHFKNGFWLITRGFFFCPEAFGPLTHEEKSA